MEFYILGNILEGQCPQYKEALLLSYLFCTHTLGGTHYLLQMVNKTT